MRLKNEAIKTMTKCYENNEVGILEFLQNMSRLLHRSFSLTPDDFHEEAEKQVESLRSTASILFLPTFVKFATHHSCLCRFRPTFTLFSLCFSLVPSPGMKKMSLSAWRRSHHHRRHHHRHQNHHQQISSGYHTKVLQLK